MHGSNFPWLEPPERLNHCWVRQWCRMALWPMRERGRETVRGRRRSKEERKSIWGGERCKEKKRRKRMKGRQFKGNRRRKTDSAPHTLTSSHEYKTHTEAGRDHFFSSKCNRQMLSITSPAEPVAHWVYTARCSSHFPPALQSPLSPPEPGVLSTRHEKVQNLMDPWQVSHDRRLTGHGTQQ